jgi:8-hydroxy-5-deazaflavin:NADPH oxidoreductase
MKISILGTGHVAQALAAGWTAKAHAVTLGSRDPANSKDLPYPTVTSAEAVAAADLVVNATPGVTALDSITRIGAEAFAGKTLLDVTNAVKPGFELLYPNDSLGRLLQELLPDTKVVKALNTVNTSVMANPGAVAPSTVFICGDDDAAKKTVTRLIEDLGWPADAILDLGGIASARGPEHYFVTFGTMVPALGTLTFNVRVVK